MDGEDDISRLSHLERRAVMRLRRRVDQLRRERDEKGGVMRGDAWWDSRMEWEERERLRHPQSPADRERKMRDEIARLRAQVKWLRDALISESVHRLHAKGDPVTQDQIRFIIGGIDGNMAVAADRAVPDANDTDAPTRITTEGV